MDYLFQAALRSVPLAAVAALGLCRVRSASAKHAGWTVVTVGMLLQIVLSPLLPALPLPVLRRIEFAAIPAAPTSATPIDVPMPREPRRLSRPLLVTGVYFAGVLFFSVRLLLAFLFTRRLVRNSERIAEDRYQSREIAVPLTFGAKILLPLDWRDWDAATLRAVLAHEEAHVRRRDWASALIARINRCVLWFHPLAWWLERRLAQLAEQACDDAALLSVPDRQQYAGALLEMARAVHASQGRLLTAAMAKEANVATRIDRILDETRCIPKALGRIGWTALIACATPLIYLAAAVEPAPAQIVMSVRPPAPPRPPQQTLAHAVLVTAQASPAPPLPPPAAAEFFPLHADVTSAQPATISIPLDSTQRYDVLVVIETEAGEKVQQLRARADRQRMFEMQAPLKAGKYVLKILVRNQNDGRMGTQQMNYEVK